MSSDHAYDLARDGANIRVSILSPTGLDAQISDNGATWLDRELVARQRMVLADEGFGKEAKRALEKRKQTLVDMGHVTISVASRPSAQDLIQRLGAATIDSRRGVRRRARTLAARRSRRLRCRPACRLHPAIK
jgi:hypothetical protein